VDSTDKAWVEDRLRWLSQEFGLDRMRSATVILPTPEFFPDPYDGSRKGVRPLFRRVCRYMKIDPGSVRLEFYRERKTPGAHGLEHGTAGLFEGSGLDSLIEASSQNEMHGDGRWYANSEKAVVRLEVSNLEDPMTVVGTLAHELGHVLLLGEGRISEGADDHEPLTDLLTVFMGLGIFTANSRVRTFRGQLKGAGYLSQPMFGHALALFAWIRNESKPAWARHLCLDVRAAFWQAHRYLQKTGDSDFDPVR
jgi:hypothetical protein